MNAKNTQQVRNLQVTDGLTVAVVPHKGHNFIMTTTEVAHGYDCSTAAIRMTLSRNPDEFIEGKHFIKSNSFVTDRYETIEKGVTNCYETNEDLSGHIVPKVNGRPSTLWTKRGIIRLGFFLKCGNAKIFRDWAEDTIIEKLKFKQHHAQLYPHEAPLYTILENYLVKGDIKTVAAELGLSPHYVSKVKRGRDKSQNVMEALIQRANHNKVNGITKGYQLKFVQYALNLFDAPKAQA